MYRAGAGSLSLSLTRNEANQVPARATLAQRAMMKKEVRLSLSLFLPLSPPPYPPSLPLLISSYFSLCDEERSMSFVQSSEHGTHMTVNA